MPLKYQFYGLAKMNTIEKLLTHIPEIETVIGYKFQNKSLLIKAFTHRSFINEQRESLKHNERLEFLGDSILGLLISDYLFRHLPNTPEGELSSLRSRLVEGTACMGYMQKIGIGKYLLLGKGERLNDGRGRDSILADLFEAIIGAIYLDGGIEAARSFILKNIASEIEDTIHMPASNWKALLQECSQKTFQKAPLYQLIDETGPDHSKVFCIAVIINGKEYGRGNGASKKEAQQAAAADVFAQGYFKESSSWS